MMLGRAWSAAGAIVNGDVASSNAPHHKRRDAKARRRREGIFEGIGVGRGKDGDSKSGNGQIEF